MHPYQNQIDHEIAKIKLLKEKIEACEQRLSMLRSMGEGDALDKLLDTELQTTRTRPATAQSNGEQSDSEIRDRQKRLPGHWLELLAFIGAEGKSSTQVRDFLVSSRSSITPDASRTGLMNYRKQFGLVDNPKRGFYTLTPKGVATVEAQQDEGPNMFR